MNCKNSGVPRISETYRLAKLLSEATRESRASAADSASTTAKNIESIDSLKVRITPLEMNSHQVAMKPQSSEIVLIGIGPSAPSVPLNRNSSTSSQKHHHSPKRISNGMRDQRQ